MVFPNQLGFMLLLFASLLAMVSTPVTAKSFGPSATSTPGPSRSHSGSHVQTPTAAAAFVHLPSAVACPLGQPGSVQCCEKLVSPTSDAAKGVISLLEISSFEAGNAVGLSCEKVLDGGITDDTLCDAALACCSDSKFGGVVAVNCTAVDIGI